MPELEQHGDRTPTPSAWEYATAPESRDIVKLEERYGLFVGGEFVEPRSGEHYTTLDPATEEPLAEIPQAGPEDVGLAVHAAREAFANGWSAAAPGRGCRDGWGGRRAGGGGKVPLRDRGDPPGARAGVRGAGFFEGGKAD